MDSKQDLRSFDWDDTALIKAYNRGMKERAAAKKGTKTNDAPQKSAKWKVGDFCRAIYPADKRFYEAKIVSLNGDFCTVEFLGYGDFEDMDLSELKKTEGKRARKRQMKEAAEYRESCSTTVDSESGDATDRTSISRGSYRVKKNRHESQVANHAAYDYTKQENTAFHAPYPPTYYAPPPPPPQVPNNMPFIPTPPAPSLPLCPSVANNPSLSSMLVAWYMAGYYTGLHSVKDDSHSSQRCCGHKSQCCHH